MRTPRLMFLLLDALAASSLACSAQPPPAPEPPTEPPTVPLASGTTPPPDPERVAATPSAEPAPSPSSALTASTTPSAEATTAPPSGAPYTTPAGLDAACANEQRNLLANLKPARPADYMELRQARIIGGNVSITPQLATGKPCATATDPVACAEALRRPNKAGFASQCGPVSCPKFLVVEQGGAVATITTVADLAAFLGPLDTPDEAALVAYANGYGLPACKGALPKKVGARWQITVDKMISDCPITHADVTLAIAATGEVTELGKTNVRKSSACVGRRPPGLAPTTAARASGPEASFLAECATLEAASVIAFERLAGELSTLGAPRSLRDGCRRAAKDEVRHARAMARIARRRGAAPSAARVDEAPAATSGARLHRELERLALDNAVEGCVRETFGALVGLHQAEAASDPEIRRAMRSIAADEVRHASLAWKIAAWLEPRLGKAARRRVERARAAAVAELSRELAAPLTAGLEGEVGLPSPARALAMARRLEVTLWQGVA